jgi:hypothetical protein
MTFLRKGERIDVFVAEATYRFPAQPCWNVSGVLVSRRLLAEFTDLSFLDEHFRVPMRYRDALVEMYGKDWRIEKKHSPALPSLDMLHPFQSVVYLLSPLIPRGVKKRLKRLLGRWFHSLMDKSGL